jgi:hypothetical protein
MPVQQREFRMNLDSSYVYAWLAIKQWINEWLILRPPAGLIWASVITVYFKNLFKLPLKLNCFYSFHSEPTLQMKAWWESNINDWFRFMHTQKWNCAASTFGKQNYNVLSPNLHIHVPYLWAIYIFPGSVCLFGCNKMGRQILGI